MDKNYLLIRIVSYLSSFYKKLGVDFEQFLLILRLKLTLDARKQGIQDYMKKESKFDSHTQNLIVVAVVGVFTGILMLSPLDIYYKVSVLAGMNMFFLVMYMISDFSSVLLDVRDSTVIMTKPVDAKTMNAARITHISYYMISMFSALNAASFVLGTVAHGIMFAFTMILMMFFMSFLIIFFTTILYGILLRFFNGEKLKDILNVLQIILSVITVVGYQVLGRMFEFVDLNLKINIHWWSYLLPSAWFGGLFKVLVERNMETSYIIMASLSIVIPIILGFVLKSFVLPKYEIYLTKLSVEGKLLAKKNNIFTYLKQFIMKIFSKDNIEFAFMEFTDANLARDRKLKLMIYPNHVLGLVFPFIMLFNIFSSGESFAKTMSEIKGSPSFLMMYLASMFLMMNFDFLKYSSNAKAAIIFDSFPIENKTIFYRGALKAYYLKFILPAMGILSAIFVFVFGIEVLSGILLINVMTLFALMIKGILTSIFIPFSTELGTSGNRNFGEAFVFFGIIGVIAGIHFIVNKWIPSFTWVMIILMILLCKKASSMLLQKKCTIEI